MTTIINAPLKQGINGLFENHYIIEDTDIEALIIFCLIRVRTKSQNFYKKELRNDLENNKISFIDIHAGMGSIYTVKYN